jgi:hypothetical protein
LGISVAGSLLKGEGWFWRTVRRATYHLVGIRYGPAMIANRGGWTYIDFDGKVYRVTPTGHPGCPLSITLEHY